MEDKFDVIIVGAGPGGIFAANELAEKCRVLVIDMGPDINERKCIMKNNGNLCAKCRICNIMSGAGGSGTFSDGTLNLRPDIGGDLAKQTGSEMYANTLVDLVDEIFVKYGAPDRLFIPKGKEVEDLKRRAASFGAKFIEIKQRHIGSDQAPVVIKNFIEDLKRRGVIFKFNTGVADIIVKKKTCEGVIIKEKKGGSRTKRIKIRSKYVIIAPGRIGASWTEEIINKHSLRAKYSPADVGVRVEVQAVTMDPITKINHDPKFHIQTKTFDDFVRTFCTNEKGFVVKEEYNDLVATNGHSMTNQISENTNFAFLVHVELTEPIENTLKYARSIAKLANTIGGKKPIIQKLGDLKKGRRSTAKRIEDNHVRNTLKDVTPGDISMALPHRIVTDIKEGLEILNEIIPGVAADSTLLYAPEVKFYSMEVIVDTNMETSINNLFAAGDGAGLSRDIVNASATGIIAARGIIKKQGF